MQGLFLAPNSYPDRLTITMAQGVVGNGEYSFNDGKDVCQVKVVKEESNELAYKVSLTFVGIFNGRPKWLLYINDKLPGMGIDKGLCYNGSKKFVVRPIDKEYLLVQETDETTSEVLFIDLANGDCQASKTLNVRPTVKVSSDKIQALVEKGKIFKPSDDKVVKMIFHDQKVGVFLYTENNLKSDIYFANESEEFEKCEATIRGRCKCPIGDSYWDVKLPKGTEIHNLAFPLTGSGSHDGHGSKISFDEIPLQNITL